MFATNIIKLQINDITSSFNLFFPWDIVTHARSTTLLRYFCFVRKWCSEMIVTVCAY